MRKEFDLLEELERVLDAHPKLDGPTIPNRTLAKFLLETLLVFGEAVDAGEVHHGRREPAPEIDLKTACRALCESVESATSNQP